jgi:hypothetical protein
MKDRREDYPAMQETRQCRNYAVRPNTPLLEHSLNMVLANQQVHFLI